MGKLKLNEVSVWVFEVSLINYVPITLMTSLNVVSALLYGIDIRKHKTSVPEILDLFSEKLKQIKAREICLVQIKDTATQRVFEVYSYGKLSRSKKNHVRELMAQGISFGQDQTDLKFDLTDSNTQYVDMKERLKSIEEGIGRDSSVVLNVDTGVLFGDHYMSFTESWDNFNLNIDRSIWLYNFTTRPSTRFDILSYWKALRKITNKSFESLYLDIMNSSEVEVLYALREDFEFIDSILEEYDVGSEGSGESLDSYIIKIRADLFSEFIKIQKTSSVLEFFVYDPLVEWKTPVFNLLETDYAVSVRYVSGYLCEDGHLSQIC